MKENGMINSPSGKSIVREGDAEMSKWRQSSNNQRH
jgi:hypothetical protein